MTPVQQIHYTKKGTIHQVTTMLVTSANVKVLGYLYQWLEGGYDMEIGHF